MTVLNTQKQSHSPAWLLLLCTASITCWGCNPKKETPKNADAPATSALIITTDYQTGAYSVINPVTRETFNSVDMIHQDSVCRYDQVTGTPFIIARLGSDAVETVSPEKRWSITNEFSVGAGSNPQDIAVISEQLAYVALYAQPYLLKINPLTGAALGTVDLSAYADADGIPEVGWLYAMDQKLYVLLQRLSRPDGFLPTAYSSLLILDAMSGAVEKELRLAQTNPFGKLRFNRFISRFVIVESGVFTTMQDGMPIDGAIELFDPQTETLSGPVVTAETLGGDIVDAVVVSKNKGYAVVGVRKGVSAETHIVAFNPGTGQKTKTLLRADSWIFNFIELTPDGSELWVADRNRNNPGIRIFDTTTDAETTVVPIDVGLPPFMICFAQSSAVIPGASTDSSGDTGRDPVEDTAFTDDTESDSDTDLGTDAVGPEMDSTPRFLDIVVDAPCADETAAFGDPLLAVNGVRGAGDGMGSLDVYSMRYCDADDQKYITLRAKGRRILNGPGADFAVFENGFKVASSDDVFMEPLVIYLSKDGLTWVPFPFDYVHIPETEYSANPDMWHGFGGIQPVFYHEEDNPSDPFNFELAGGDQFDLDDLPNDGEALAIKQDGFVFIRLMAASSVRNPDTGDFFPKDASSFDGAADLDGVYVRYTRKAYGEESTDTEYGDTDTLLADTDTLLADTDTLLTDTDTLFADPDSVFAGSDSLPGDPDTGLTDTDTLLADTDTLLADTDTLLADSDTVLADSDTVLADPDTVLADSDAILTDTETILDTDADSDGCRDDLIPKNGVCIPADGFDNYVGLVVDYGNGDGIAACVGYDGQDGISGISLLQLAGVTLALGFNDMAVCGMDDVGCAEDGPDGCWCECSMAPGTDCIYWSYHQNTGDGIWEYSQIGAGERMLTTGELDGWYWGIGTPEGAPTPGTDWMEVPAPATFENVCVF